MSDFIATGQKFSKQLTEINSHNSIAVKLSRVLSDLNSHTNVYLTEILLPSIDKVAQTHPDDEELTKLQSIFQRLCYTVGVDRNSDKLDVNTNQLQAIAQEWASMIETETDGVQLDDAEYTQVANALNGLIASYLVIFLWQKRSCELIYDTIAYKNQLKYWTDLKGSLISKVVFFIQTLPVKLYELGTLLFENVKEILQDSLEQDVAASAKLVVDSSCRTMLKLLNTVPSFSINKMNNSAFSKAKLIYRTPIEIINREVKQKTRFLHQRINDNCYTLGHLINNIPESVTSNLGGRVEKSAAISVLKILSDNDKDQQHYKMQIAELFDSHIDYQDLRPSTLTRYWPLVFAVLRYGPSNSMNIYKNRNEIFNWLKFNLYDTAVGFVKNWVVEPVLNMLSILRNDEDFQGLSITTKDSLHSDLDSLERMVIDYASDYGNGNGPSAEMVAQIHESVQKGDMTAVMANYEQDLRLPVKALARGSLVRALLIQLQKTKVDGQVAVSGIDKMLKSQQLVFGVVSISPSFLILYLCFQLVVAKSSRPITLKGKQLNIVCLRSLNYIEKIVSQPQDSLAKGRLFIEITSLQLHSVYFIPPQLYPDWLLDLNDLTATTDALGILSRIWTVYGPYFR